MLRDVFYYGKKPNVHPRERYAKNLADARKQSTTQDFWIINEFCDYTNFEWDFDFDFLPDEDVWAQDHNNAWPSIYQKDSGTWLCSKNESEVIIYRNDVTPLKRKKERSDNWTVHYKIDEHKFDFGWHPDPSSPPYIYVWGNQWVPGKVTPTVEYKVPGATEIKHMETIAFVVADMSKWDILEPVDLHSFDFSWMPDPTAPPYIYVWGNQWNKAEDKISVQYKVDGATEYKYMPGRIKKQPDTKHWLIPNNIDTKDFDFSWEPNPHEPKYIYQFGTQWQKTGGPQYVPDGITILDNKKALGEYKYIDIQKAKKLPEPDKFTKLVDNQILDFDYSWHPDDTEPPYIYRFGNDQYPAETMPTMEYIVPRATETKYIGDVVAKLGVSLKNWYIPDNVDVSKFDFSWVPNPKDPPYIYQFGTQWQKTGGPRYVVEGATEFKYIEEPVAKALPSKKNWKIPSNIDTSDFDFSWHPDPLSPPYIYHFGTQWQDTGGPVYEVKGATQIKYVTEIKAKALATKKNWKIPKEVDKKNFDFSWHPSALDDEPYIYVFGTQHQKTGGPKYVSPGATKFSPVKYVETQKATRLPDKKKFKVLYNYKVAEFDYSWHPDDTDEPFIYVFGNNWWGAETMPTLEYEVEGATKKKYVNEIVAKLGPDKTFWLVPNNIDLEGFDFSWKPNPFDPPYIYKFGTQWQKTGGPEYWTPDATDVKYMDFQKVKALPNKKDKNWIIPNHIDVTDFDFSWHPDETSPPYIYQFGTQWALTGGPKYVVRGGVEIKYMEEPLAKALPNRENWVVPADVDAESFDFSWHPYVEDKPYIYVFGTQHQKTGGPRYMTPGVDGTSATKYIDRRVLQAKRLPNKKRFSILFDSKIKDFDFSWHPDERDEPYTYHFGSNHYAPEIMPCIEYRVAGAKTIKYVHDIKATLDVDMTNWVIPENVTVPENFDFTWRPNVRDPEYIYEYGTQWQKTGGPRYVVEGATEIKYMDSVKATALPTTEHWEIVGNNKIKDFDYSWHPDRTEEPYIYVFGNNYWPGEIMPTIRYVVPGATQIKYIDSVKATLDVNMDNWQVPNDVDTTGFDFSWVPNPLDPAYIYEFGTQWQKTGGPRYIVEGATEFKYVDTMKVRALPKKSEHWVVEEGIKIKDFDYSWHPDSTDDPFIYVFGNTLHPAEIMPTIRYVVPGATAIKYVHDCKATLGINMSNWKVPANVDVSNFDFSWIPDPTNPPYIYEFGTQWQKTGGPKYIVKNATDIKYVDTMKAKALPNLHEHWRNVDDVLVSQFDYSWHPDSTEDPYIYVFGNTQYGPEKMPTIKYVVPGATQLKYVQEPKAVLKHNKKNWKLLLDVKLIDFDYSWVPDPNDPPYIYVFGNQWHDAVKEPTIEYRVPGATEKKYVKDITAQIAPNIKNWTVLYPIDETKFDFSWRPDPNDPPYIYIFGNQWNKAEVEQTVKYTISGATDKKYVNDVVPVILPDMDRWEIPEGVNVDNFDFSWRPDPGSPPYIYQFGTIENDEDGPKYVHPDHRGEVVRLRRIEKQKEKEQPVNQYHITTTLEDLANEHTDELFWALNPDIDYSEFDFSWRPSIEQARYVHAFGSADNINTQTYFVNGPQWARGNREINYVEDKDVKLKVIVDMFFVDKGNSEAQDRFNALKAKYGDKIQKTRYLNSWVDTINRCINRASTNLCWILNSELDYNNFNFDYYPNPWQTKMVHVFGTQWNHWGTTFMVNRETFPTDTKWIKIIEHLNNLNFVKDRKARATNNLYDIVLIDHGNRETASVKKMLEGKSNGKNVSVFEYRDSYFETLKSLVKGMNPKKEHYIWICSSICDYSGFDFSYICDPFAKDNLHVFSTGRQKFGDTFLIDVNKTLEIIDSIDTLQAYHKVNYTNQFSIHRLPAPVIYTDGDTHTSNIKEEFDFPYAIFMTEELDVPDTEPMSLWTEETKNILITSTGGTRIIVPKEARGYIKDQLYDYPYIKTASKLVASKPLDIVFLSNGEKCADENYEHLLAVTKGLKNRVVRVDGVNGRVEAYHAAAKASNSPWAFTVFAKLKVNPKFDWGWQPDRLQIPKHYIFHARNPVNGLEYGHQGMIAYNKKMTLDNTGKGLDFTLDDPHETVTVLSGIATFNTDEYSTWRTAFREVIKLKSDYEDISQRRLDTWLNKAEGDYAEYCLKGANDAVEYYDSVSGDIDKLKLSYEWKWLKEYYNKKYK